MVHTFKAFEKQIFFQVILKKTKILKSSHSNSFQDIVEEVAVAGCKISKYGQFTWDNSAQQSQHCSTTRRVFMRHCPTYMWHALSKPAAWCSRWMSLFLGGLGPCLPWRPGKSCLRNGVCSATRYSWQNKIIKSFVPKIVN